MKIRIELEVNILGDDVSYGELMSALLPATRGFAKVMRPLGETRMLGAKAILPRDNSLAAAVEYAITAEGVQ